MPEEHVLVDRLSSDIRRIMSEFKKLSADKNDKLDYRHIAMVVTKLEEAELLATRIVNEEEEN